MELDNIDLKILHSLSENSRIQWKELGKEIHMTGQAVGNRIKKLEENGIIKAYTLALNDLKLGMNYTAFVIIYMKTAQHELFIQYINSQKEVIEAHRVSGAGCYHLKIKIDSQKKLNNILNEILEYGNYQLYLSVNEVKNNHILF